MQINGTTLTKRQKHLIGGALFREQNRATDAMRIIETTAAAPEAIEHVSRAVFFTIKEISTLIDLIDQDQEAEK